MQQRQPNRRIPDRSTADRSRFGSHTDSAPRLALLVDRDADSRSLYATHLGMNGYATEEASDGREALAKALARRFDVIVMDARLPGIDGYDLCQLLRNDPVTRVVPIIMLTGDTTDVATQRGRKVGADSVLTKPSVPEDLLADLRRLLSLRVPAHENGETGNGSDSETSRALPSRANGPRLSRDHRRYATTEPPLAPPSLMCPTCDSVLGYERSHVGGVSARHSEQWDDFRCPAGCGLFQYRHRTRKLRRTT